MIPTMILFGLLLARWWKLTLIVGPAAWTVLLWSQGLLTTRRLRSPEPPHWPWSTPPSACWSTSSCWQSCVAFVVNGRPPLGSHADDRTCRIWCDSLTPGDAGRTLWNGYFTDSDPRRVAPRSRTVFAAPLLPTWPGSRGSRGCTPSPTCAALSPGARNATWTPWPPSDPTLSCTCGGCRKCAGTSRPRSAAGSRWWPASTAPA